MTKDQRQQITEALDAAGTTDANGRRVIHMVHMLQIAVRFKVPPLAVSKLVDELATRPA